MKIWFDTEFIEDGRTIDLISIGMVAENGVEFYAENKECDLSRASPWVKENVLPHLEGSLAQRTRADIAYAIEYFARSNPEFWGYYADYDWVVLCQLFGTMMDLPKSWPMYCRNIKQLCDSIGNPKLPEQGKGEHHALADAKWNRLAYEFLCQIRVGANAPPTYKEPWPMPFDSTPQVTPALALLRAARAKLEDPRNWVKHDPARWELKEGLHCPISSISYGAAWTFPVREALDALSASLPPGRWGRHVDQFSDAPETTHADILALFDRAERRLMEGGA